jgi:hypothetical protein
MCCFVRVKTLIFKICFIKNNRIFQLIRIHQNTSHTTPPTHTGPTQYRRPTVKEHDHHWDSQQDSNAENVFVMSL